MSLLLRSIRLLSDPTRLRILLLLNHEELSVLELQQILAKGQSQISTHLSQLKGAGLLSDRRTGKNVFYRLKPDTGRDGEFPEFLKLLERASRDLPEAADDREALELVLAKRRDRTRQFFDSLAGRFGREYMPGRSWHGLAEALFSMMPPLVIADLGAGEGTFAQLMARRAKKIIAVDSSERMVEFGREAARNHQFENLEYRLGDLETLPIEDAEVDVAFFSQSLHHALRPERAIAEAARALKPGGRIVILDLLRHQFEEARELYADIWLGFSEHELRSFLKSSHFTNISSAVVHREVDAPHFETVLAAADKPGC